MWRDIQATFGDSQSPQTTALTAPKPLETPTLTPAVQPVIAPTTAEPYAEPKIPPDVPTWKAASLQKAQADSECPPSKTPTKAKALLAKKSGPHSITIDNGTSSNAVVKLRSTKTGKDVVALFVPRHAKYTYPKVPTGDFAILFALGEVYSAKCLAFSGEFWASRFETDEHFATRATETMVYYQTLELTLHTVAGGTAQTKRVANSEFLSGQ